MKQLVVCIDLEQDDVRSPAAALTGWHGAAVALAWRETWPWGDGAVMNWFVRNDVQTETVLGDRTWPLRHLLPALRRARGRGDTVGAHPHLYRATGDGWRNDFADVDHAWRCAEVALQAHQEVFGEPCRTWRWGDRVTHPLLRPRLAAAGVLVDNTAEPGRPSAPPPDGGDGLKPSWVGHSAEPVVIDGLVQWPTTTVVLADATVPASGRHAVLPVGSFDVISDAWLAGWCADATPGSEAHVVDIELLVRGVAVATTAADWHRPDVAAAGYGDGRHGARIGMRDEWRSLPPSAFSLRAAGHAAPLHAPPCDLRTSHGAEHTIIPLPAESDPEQFSRLLDVAMRSSNSHVSLALRSDAFADPATVAMVDANCRTLAALTSAGLLSAPRSLVELAAPLLSAPSALAV